MKQLLWTCDRCGASTTTTQDQIGKPGLDDLSASVQGLRYGTEVSQGATLPGAQNGRETASLIEEFERLADRARAAGLDLAALTGGGV